MSEYPDKAIEPAMFEMADKHECAVQPTEPELALEEFPYTLDEDKVIAIVRKTHYSAEWVRKILMEMADDNFLYLSDQQAHQEFLLTADVYALAGYVDASTDAYYRAIER